jgi:hypothetical protein
MEMDEDMGLAKYGSPAQRFSYLLPDESQPRIFLKLAWDRDDDDDSSSYGASDESDEDEGERHREQAQERACRWRDALPCSSSLGSAPEWGDELTTLAGTSCVMVCGSNMGTTQRHECKGCLKRFKRPICKESGKCNACKNKDEEDDDKEEEGEPEDAEEEEEDIITAKLQQAQDGVDVARRELPGCESVFLTASRDYKLLRF